MSFNSADEPGNRASDVAFTVSNSMDGVPTPLGSGSRRTHTESVQCCEHFPPAAELDDAPLEMGLTCRERVLLVANTLARILQQDAILRTEHLCQSRWVRIFYRDENLIDFGGLVSEGLSGSIGTG